MKKALQTLPLLFLFLSNNVSLLAQCPSSGGPICYSQTSTVEPIAVDICPTAGMAVEVSFTAGQVENNFDELLIFCGTAGSGTGGTQIYSGYGTGGNLTGLVVPCAVADDCISIYVNSDASVTCATNGYTPISYNISCVTATCSGTVSACYGNNQSENLLMEICPSAGFSQIDIEFLTGDIETSFDDLDIYSGPTGSGTAGTLLANDLDGDLTGLTYGGMSANDCISLIISSDGAVSCASTATINAMSICVTSSVPLPISLLSFEGKAMKKGNKIQWSTAEEQNTLMHIIEKSANGQDKWIEAGRLDAAGFTNSVHEYQIMDHTPFAQTYYRLRSVDYDGTYQLSEVVVIEREVEAFKLLSLFPVPTSQNLTVRYELAESAEIQYQLFSMTGQALLSQSFDANTGLNQIELDLSSLPTGVYMLQLSNGTSQQVQRVVKK